MHKHVLTRRGLALLGKKEAELANPNVTKVVAGAGFADWDALEELTQVLEPIAEMEIGEKQLIDGKTVRLPVQLSNLELTETALIRQIGVYSLDPEEGEILYQIVQYELPIPLPSYAANNGGVIVFDPELDLLFQNGELVSAPLTPGFLVTAKKLQEEMEGLKKELDVALSNKANGRNYDGVLNIYVSVDGNDENSGTEKAPFRTIGKGIAYAKQWITTDMCMVRIGDGEYRENIHMSGMNNVWIGSLSGDPSKVILRGATTGTVIGVFTSTAVSIAGITIEGSGNQNGLIYGNVSTVSIKRCRISKTGSGVTFGISSNQGFMNATENEINNTDTAFVSDGALMWTYDNTGSGNGVGANAVRGIITVGGTRPEANTAAVELYGGRVFD